ncbi:MAG: type II toxin-antitoxin system VapC family toxin [Terracidiphilus sp.]|jgi:PIN domain nuclease of toxin-antitoxin system
MRLLLDTQIVYWLFYEPNSLPKKAREQIVEAAAVYVSSVTVWEIAIKVRIGKMNADPKQLVLLLESAGFRELPVFSRHAVLVADLPLHHADPFDRLLVAQAMSEPLNLLTADTQLMQYGPIVLIV